ncbi:MAG: hypothetical protein GY847_21260 [Proteobacteria bacterium]|nr:hypothetical protein [Pseudomonadota bacterium]
MTEGLSKWIADNRTNVNSTPLPYQQQRTEGAGFTAPDQDSDFVSADGTDDIEQVGVRAGQPLLHLDLFACAMTVGCLDRGNGKKDENFEDHDNGGRENEKCS